MVTDSDFPFTIGPDTAFVLVEPNGGEVWPREGRVPIVWDPRPPADPDWDIAGVLYKGEQPVRFISAGLSYMNRGFINWRLPAPKLEVGEDYRFELVVPNQPRIRDLSDGPFTVSDRAEPLISVIEPRGIAPCAKQAYCHIRISLS